MASRSQFNAGAQAARKVFRRIVRKLRKAGADPKTLDAVEAGLKASVALAQHRKGGIGKK